ncbi:MAG: hypothetical protein LBC85_03935 [Fibromonadaceae bacterium]|jgi:hypothetical protein|nr:hypothetical protein [Fibromonadaceae bacterium]
MGFLFSSRSEEYSKKLGLKYWFRIWILLIITGLLTWYGKIYEAPPSFTYINDFAVWVVPHKNGLGALIALPNDNIDSNNAKTGLRIWISPPDSILAFERNGIRYRGRNIIVVGDSLNENLREDMLSTLNKDGNLFWLSNLNEKYTGVDVHAELKLFNNKPQDFLLDLIYEGHKLRFFGSQTALDSTSEEPLSVAFLMFKPEDENEAPLKDNTQVQVLIWRGKNENGTDPSRIALNYAEAHALVSFNRTLGLRAQRMHLKNWNPDH